MVYHSAEDVPDFVSMYLNRPTANITSIAVEEDQRPEVTNIIDMQDGLHQYEV